MKLNIIYSDDAISTLNSIHDFITLRFSLNVADKFLDKAEKTVTLISENPMMFKSTGLGADIRKGFITQQTSVSIKYRIQKYCSCISGTTDKNRIFYNL